MFTVSGVPGVQGITAQDGKVATANAYWSEGPCSFGSGQYLPDGGKLSTEQIAHAVVAGIKSQHARMHRLCS